MGFELSRSGPLIGLGFEVSRSGPLIGVLGVTVWSADCSFEVSRSGPLIEVLQDIFAISVIDRRHKLRSAGDPGNQCLHVTRDVGFLCRNSGQFLWERCGGFPIRKP